MKNKFLNIIGILFISVVGGIIAQQFVWPWLLQYSFFSNYKESETPIYNITEKDEIFIQENTALEEAVKKVESSIIGVKTITQDEENLEGSGLIITSDGLIVTLAELVPLGSNFSFYIDGELSSYQVLKRDLENNLALIKLGKENLKTLSFAEKDKIKLGERVFLLGFVFDKKGLNKVVNEGTIRLLKEDLIETNIFEKESLLGSPLIDIEGRLVGLNTINENGRVVAIPVDKIKNFTGF